MASRRRGAEWIPRARQCAELADTGLSQREIAEQLDLPQPYVSTALRVARLPDEVRDQLERNEITIAQAIPKGPPRQRREPADRPVPSEERRHVRVVPIGTSKPDDEDLAHHAFDVVLSDKELVDVAAHCRALGVQPGALGRKLFTSWLRQVAA